ncbi:MAG: galU [Phycisphaerales bacterium]|nr:galU [Phycisphaerales bacterium]
MNVTKAVIPAAGFGTRMLPAAKAVPKELLPVLDKPTIQYVVEEAAAAGIDDVLLVTSREKKAVEDHFDRIPELEARLAASGKPALLASVAALAERVKVHAVRQAEQKGLGDAVYQAKRHVGSAPFVCMLGDTIFSTTGGAESPTTALVAAYEKYGTSVIALEEVPAEKVSRYGIVGGAMVEDGVIKLDRLVEKPTPEAAPSRLAVAARYLLTPAIFACLEETKPGKGGEIQLTDALQLLLAREPIHGVVVKARRHDIGNPVDWLKTNLLYASRDPVMWKAIEPMVRELLG